MKKLLALAAAATVSFSVSQAAFLDFVAEADANERGENDGYTQTFVGSDGSVDVTFSASGGIVGSEADVFFDASTAVGPGGLGACRLVGGIGGAGSTCIRQSDDQIEGSFGRGNTDETVSLSFNRLVTAKNFGFVAGDHTAINPLATLLINGLEYTFAAASSLVFKDISAISFGFGGSNAAGFYVTGFDAAVPVPAAAPLLLSGIAGLAFASRRRRRA